jgi:hypothetical protein
VICDIHENDMGRKSLRLPNDAIRGCHGQIGLGAHGVRHAGSIHQNLEHCALVIVRGEHCN